jgi:hypothetical protein
VEFGRKLVKCRSPIFRILAIAITVLMLTACSLPQISAEQRLFLNLSVDYLGEYQLPKTKYKDTPVGGLSALTYDRARDRYYAVSDDRSQFAPARFYTLKLDLNNTGIQNITLENVTLLKTEDNQTYPKSTIDPEGIALTPQKTVYISSEGVTRDGIAPFVREFDLQTGQQKQNLPIPERYVPDATDDKQQRGVQDNLGFESLTLNPIGTVPASGEPIRLFAATESALIQDRDSVQLDEQGKPKPQTIKSRLLHYLIGDGPPILISEHLYPLAPTPEGALAHGLTELLAVDQAGHFISLERSFGLSGFTVRLYQVATGGATDTSRIASLKGDVSGIQPARKKLLLDLTELGIRLDNLEGMTLGPRLPDGSQSLILVSDDNFKDEQVTQFLLFRLNSGRQA